MKIINRLIVIVIFLGIINSCTKKVFIEAAPELKIIVKDSNNDLVKGAEVSLYKTELDFFDQTNAIISGQTDSIGVCLFKNLKNESYFFHVKFDAATNMWSTNYVDSLVAGKRFIVITTLISSDQNNLNSEL